MLRFVPFKDIPPTAFAGLSVIHLSRALTVLTFSFHYSRLLRGVLILFLGGHQLIWAGTAPQSNSLLALSDDGVLIACSNRDSGTVTILDWPSLGKRSETSVGLHPEGTTFISGTHLVACCAYGTDEIIVLDADSGSVAHRIAVFDEPYGIVSSPDGHFLYVTLEYPGRIIRINTETWDVDAEWEVGHMLRGIALSADGQQLFVTEYLTARLLQISTADGSVTQTFDGASTDNIARQVSLHPTQSKAYMPHIRSRVKAAHGNGSIFPYVGVTTYAGEHSGRRLRIPMDTFRSTRVVANPWEVAVSPDGSELFVVFSGTNDLYMAKVESNTQELTHIATLRLGNNPRAVRVTSDGKHLLIYNALDFELVAYSVPELKEVRRVVVTKNPLTDEHRLGKLLFYTALQPMSGRHWISCSSCHIDGDADGRTWQQPEGLRQTQPLNGLARTHPLHWSADRDEVHDFEHTIRGDLMQGKGLLQGHLPDALGVAIGGRSGLLDALAVYTNSHGFTLSPHSRNGLTASATRGRRIFHSKKTKCAVCHSGPMYTDSRATPGTDFKLHDVGTGKSDPSERMPPAYDTPTLLGVYRSAPYLHHGAASTLRDVLTTMNPNDQHGYTSHLSEREIDDMVEFLRSLPFEDPTLETVGAKTIERTGK